MKQEDIKKILKGHQGWLDGDVAGIKADLMGSNLEGADLGGANLEEADLTMANLREANLEEADLTMANLREANLTRADLTMANLEEADLTMANLREAIMCGITLGFIVEASDIGDKLPTADAVIAALTPEEWKSILEGRS